MKFRQSGFFLASSARAHQTLVVGWWLAFFDQVGVALSALCLVHCLFMPLALIFLPLASAVSGDHWFHHAMAIAIAPVALFSFVSGVRLHRSPWVLLLGGVGMGLLLAGVAYSHGVWPAALTVSGSVFLVIGHRINRSLCRRQCFPQPPSAASGEHQCCYQSKAK